MPVATRVAPRSRFYLYMAMVFLAISIAGFSTTFLIPLGHGAFRAPPLIHVHGALLFGWLLFFILQASLVHRRRVLTHRQLGVVGSLLCIAVVVSGVQVGLFATRRDLAGAGDGEAFVLGQFINVLIEMLLFGSLVFAAVLFRKDTETHKRLLLLATISVIGPAWFRLRHLMPWMPQPLVVFGLLADSLLLVAMARDWRMMRRIHPAYLWGGGAMVSVHVVELLAITSDPWQRLARWLLGVPA